MCFSSRIWDRLNQFFVIDFKGVGGALCEGTRNFDRTENRTKDRDQVWSGTGTGTKTKTGSGTMTKNESMICNQKKTL